MKATKIEIANVYVDCPHCGGPLRYTHPESFEKSMQIPPPYASGLDPLHEYTCEHCEKESAIDWAGVPGAIHGTGV